MSLGPVKARNFWQQLDNDSKDSFDRNMSIRNSFNSSQKLTDSIIRDSIYCTIRNPKGRRSVSVPNQRAVLTTVPTIHYPQLKSRKMETKTRPENLTTPKKIDPTCRGPKRYETLCYFKPLAVPVWYSSSITLQVNSTKKKYTENITYKNKFVPYRYIEKMTTIISSSRPKNFVTNLGIQVEVPEEHIISLEPQQKAVNPLFTTDHSIKVENYC